MKLKLQMEGRSLKEEKQKVQFCLRYEPIGPCQCRETGLSHNYYSIVKFFPHVYQDPRKHNKTPRRNTPRGPVKVKEKAYIHILLGIFLLLDLCTAFGIGC